MRENEEVLRFTGLLPDGNLRSPGEIVAVDPRTGEERVLLEDLDSVHSARWSGDGRWLAYETDATEGVGRYLWVAGGSQAPHVVATGGAPLDPYPGGHLDWKWSPTGAELATVDDNARLRTIDVATGETTDLGAVVADLLPSASALPWPWAWSQRWNTSGVRSPGVHPTARSTRSTAEWRAFAPRSPAGLDREDSVVAGRGPHRRPDAGGRRRSPVRAGRRRIGHPHGGRRQQLARLRMVSGRNATRVRLGGGERGWTGSRRWTAPLLPGSGRSLAITASGRRGGTTSSASPRGRRTAPRWRSGNSARPAR